MDKETPQQTVCISLISCEALFTLRNLLFYSDFLSSNLMRYKIDTGYSFTGKLLKLCSEWGWTQSPSPMLLIRSNLKLLTFSVLYEFSATKLLVIYKQRPLISWTFALHSSRQYLCQTINEQLRRTSCSHPICLQNSIIRPKFTLISRG